MKFFFPLLFFFTALSVSAISDVALNDPTTLSSYELTLTYDSTNDTFLPVTGSTSAYYIIREEFVPKPTSFTGEFLGILVGPNEKIYQRFGIAKPKNLITGENVTFFTLAPYHPSAERIDVYKGATKLFSIDVTGSRLCVLDGMCHADVGENNQNCSADCDIVPPPPPPTKVEPAQPSIRPLAPGALPPTVTNTQSPSQDKEPLPPFLLPLIFFGLGLVSFGVWMYMRKKARDA